PRQVAVDRHAVALEQLLLGLPGILAGAADRLAHLRRQRVDPAQARLAVVAHALPPQDAASADPRYIVRKLCASENSFCASISLPWASFSIAAACLSSGSSLAHFCCGVRLLVSATETQSANTLMISCCDLRYSA